ncbi:recombinase RecA [Zavarzinella formosa]|uniref:recombinase RecA n=1 Tax=Zavarzinella formosa TaxID=360055 RepID=UPI0012F731C7|nr:recombinase RecA [Zavarzinella formosa]
MAQPSKELQNTLSAIEKEFGKGSIMMMGDATNNEVIGISTGSMSLDVALGGKGLPRGRIIEIYGAESSGKTTIALHAVANAQKAGGVAAYIDAEHALDPTWCKRIGVDLESLLVSQPAFGEEALRIAEMLIKSNAVDIIVIDSVAALVPKNETDNEIGTPSVGQQARLMSQALRVLNPLIAKTNTCIIFINQIRQKIGVMYGNPETTTGGLALKFYASCRLEVRRGPAVKDGDEVIGTEVKVKVVKNKIAPPFRTAEFEVLHDRGINTFSDLVNIASDLGVLEKSGSFFSFEGTRLGQGKENVKQYLTENVALSEQVKAKVLQVVAVKAGIIGGEPAPGDVDDEIEEPEPEPVEAPKSKKKSKGSED